MSAQELVSLGFVATTKLSSRWGRIDVLERESPATFLVRARGYIGPKLLRRDLELARIFGERHPNGWDYAADVSGVRVANPLNLIWLRHVRALPHVRRYVVIAPATWMKLAIAALGWCVRPDSVLDSLSDLDAR